MKTLKYSFMFAVVIGLLIHTAPTADAGRGGKGASKPRIGGSKHHKPRTGGSMHQRSNPQPKHSPKSFRVSPRNTPTGGSMHKTPTTQGNTKGGGSMRNPAMVHPLPKHSPKSFRVSPQVKPGVKQNQAMSPGNLSSAPAAGGSAPQVISKTKNPSSSQGSTSRPGVVANQGAAGTAAGGITPKGFEPQVKKPLKDPSGQSPATPSAPLPNSNWQLAQ